MFGWNFATNLTTWYYILGGAAVKSAIVLAAAWIAAFLLRKQSAATRHLMWTATFAAILALPFLSAALPALRVPFSGMALPEPAGAHFLTTAASSAGSGAAGIATPGGVTSALRPAGWRPDWSMWLLLLWAAGAATAFGRTLVGYGVAWRVRRTAGRSPDNGLAAALARTLGIRRPVDVLTIRQGSMPVAFGVRRPVVLMPADASAWSEDRRRAVLLHELAHVRRGDAATHLLARAAVDLYWWNPLAWTAWRAFLKERERAADDLVLNVGACASEYASHLLEVARTMHGSPAMAWAVPGMARRSQLEGRLLAILDSGVDRSAPSRASILAVAMLALAIVAPIAAVHAQEPSPQAVPADADAAIRAAQSQKNYEALDAAAKAATLSHQYDVAQRLLEAGLAIRAEVAGEQSVEYGVGLVKLGELEQKRDPKSGGDLYAQAAQILGERPEAARALTHLGIAAIAGRDFTQAIEHFQHAQQVDPAQAGTALMWMAVARQAEQNMVDAERRYQSAIATQDLKPVEAAVIMEVYAQFLSAQGRSDEARDFETRAAAIQKANAGPLPARPADVSRVGGGVTAPSVVKKTEPEYSEEARVARLQGTVVVQLVIGTDGRVRDPRIVRGLGLGLDENAIEAINQWQFKPGQKNGDAVKVWATIEVNYRLL
ncbi:MAG TPA: TonB family protein [Bryobacteraceae bacterium]|nr:TonB family protein [Bryobacteraceae bacterium]